MAGPVPLFGSFFVSESDPALYSVLPPNCGASNERLSISRKMHGFSTVDGFMDVNESLSEMIKYIANEPSVGLFYVQQHIQNAAPNLINIKDRVVENSHDITLHTEDLEDSISMVRSMEEFGLPITDEMNRDIKRSLLMMSTSQPKKGLIRNLSSGFPMSRSSSWGSAAFGFNAGRTGQDGGRRGGYLSTVLNSAKQRAANIRWPQLDASSLTDQRVVASTVPGVAAETSSAPSDIEADELPLSSHTVGEQLDVPTTVEEHLDVSTTVYERFPSHDVSSTPENYEEFKTEKEAKLQEWLEEIENRSGLVEAGNANAC